MSWTAEFRGGPTPPHARHFVAPGLLERVWFARVDDRDLDGWVLVGMEPGVGPPDDPWPEQAEYVLDRSASKLREVTDPAENQGHAVFRYIDETVLVQYTIYDHPRDFPDSFVVRRWRITREGPVPDPHVTATAETLDEARSFVPEGMVNIGRMPGDDAVIAEVWT